MWFMDIGKFDITMGLASLGEANFSVPPPLPPESPSSLNLGEILVKVGSSIGFAEAWIRAEASTMAQSCKEAAVKRIPTPVKVAWNWTPTNVKIAVAFSLAFLAWNHWHKSDQNGKATVTKNYYLTNCTVTIA